MINNYGIIEIKLQRTLIKALPLHDFLMLLSTLHIQKMGQKTFWVMIALLLNEMHTVLLQPRHASERDAVGKGRKNSLIVPATMWTRSL